MMTDKPHSPSQQWDAALYRSNAAFVSSLGHDVLTMLAPQPGEQVLDLGCGDGALTQQLSDAGCIVVGVDASASMVAAAQARGLDARCLDAQALSFEAQFDAVFSNAALHWMLQPEAVVSGVYRALKPGGRFVAEMGGFGNVSSVVEALATATRARGLQVQNPWYFPQPDQYRRLLEAAGFRVTSMQHFPRPTPLPGPITAWLETFAQSWTQSLPAAEQADFLAEVASALRPRLCDRNGQWQVDYVRLRFAATRPG